MTQDQIDEFATVYSRTCLAAIYIEGMNWFTAEPTVLISLHSILNSIPHITYLMNFEESKHKSLIPQKFLSTLQII